MKKALSIDVGGTKIYNTIINENGEVVGEIEKRNTPKTFVEIQNIFKEIIAKYENEVDVIAFATAGAVNNSNTGVLGSTGNLPKEYPTMDFQSFSKKNVFVENDANAAAWAEHIIGASKGTSYSVMITLGTGVGGGIILNNCLMKGKNGAAGEMHFKMRTDNHRKCTCGTYDCFEAYASGTGLKLTAEEILNNKDVTTYDVIERVKDTIRHSEANAEESQTKILRSAQYDELVLSFLNWQDDILAGLVGLANLFDPDVLVLSGSMAEFVDTDYLEYEVNSQIVTTSTKVVKAKAGNYSGMIGAALLAMGVGKEECGKY